MSESSDTGGKVLTFDEPHETAGLLCHNCGKYAVHVWPARCPQNRLECHGCHAIGQLEAMTPPLPADQAEPVLATGRASAGVPPEAAPPQDVAELINHVGCASLDDAEGCCDKCSAIRKLLASRPAPVEPRWQPMETHDGSSKEVLLRVPFDNSLNAKCQTVVGFFAKAGTQQMDDECDNDDGTVNENGENAADAWFEVSANREPYAWMLTFAPVAWMPLPFQNGAKISGATE